MLADYSAGHLLVAGDNRYLSDDLMRLLAYIVKTSGGNNTALEKECLSGNTIYAPQPGYPACNAYTLLRSPHIARNEEAAVVPLVKDGKIRSKYLSHLHYVVMVDSRSLIPERLGGADFNGDMVKTKMLFSLALTDTKNPLRMCKNCQRVFIAQNNDEEFCSEHCRATCSAVPQKNIPPGDFKG